LPSSELGSWTLRLFETEISCRKLFLLIGWQSLHLLRRQTLMQRDKIEIVLLLLCKGEVLLPLLIFNLLRLQILDLLLTLRTQPCGFGCMVIKAICGMMCGFASKKSLMLLKPALAGFFLPSGDLQGPYPLRLSFLLSLLGNDN